jgi:hypothetical protein
LKIIDLLNSLTELYHSLIHGKRKCIYNGVDYIFRIGKLIIGYDKSINYLYLFQEGNKDFYYGIKYEYFMDKNPHIYRLVKSNNSKKITQQHLLKKTKNGFI